MENCKERTNTDWQTYVSGDMTMIPGSPSGKIWGQGKLGGIDELGHTRDLDLDSSSECSNL